MIVNIETYTDADFVQSFVYKTALGVPIDLGSDSLRFMIRTRAADATAHIECSSHNGLITITNAALGEFTLKIPVDQLLILSPGSYVHSMIKTAPITFLRKDIWRGVLTHAAGPTRWTLGTQ